MAEEFRFELSQEEKDYLRELVRLAILKRLNNKDADDLPDPPTDKLKEPLGAFVTLKIAGNLRGCIGNVYGDKPLHLTVARMAQAAAFEDPRFPPLTAKEFDQTSIDISILSPVTECPDPLKVEIGRHGLIIRKGGRSGLLLPQVPVEWGWDLTTFLEHTCAKAGLPKNSWKDPSAQLYWFEAEVF
ncbi:MAG: AmmeMemoRadiSam system protein A [Desulfovibrio sp.]|nr:MAG: AmmeMemoRadiSam system protein A [Desulfovibrio sp.]